MGSVEDDSGPTNQRDYLMGAVVVLEPWAAIRSGQAMRMDLAEWPDANDEANPRPV